VTAAAVAPLEVTHPSGWTWQPETKRYRDPSTGRFASNATIRDWRNTFLDRRMSSVRDLSTALANGWVTLPSWQQQMGEVQRETYGIMAALGRGGINAMQEADWTKLNDQLRDQLPYIENFASDIAAGNLTEAQIGARSELYIGTSVQAFESARAAAWGDPDLPMLPGDGNTECGGNCRCSWDINPTETAWECSWVGQDDEHTCSGCQDNQATWDPLIIEYPPSDRLGPANELQSPDSLEAPALPQTLEWNQEKGSRHVSADGRFQMVYEKGWNLVDTKTGIREPVKMLRAGQQRAEAILKAEGGGATLPPPTPVKIEPPVVHPLIVPIPPAFVEPVSWGKTSANRFTSENVRIGGEHGIVRFEVLYAKSGGGWDLKDNLTGASEHFKTNALAKNRADEILKEKTGGATPSHEMVVGARTKVMGGEYHAGETGTVIKIEVQPNGERRITLRIGDGYTTTTYTTSELNLTTPEPPLEYAGVKVGVPVEVVGGGYRMGHQGTVTYIDTKNLPSPRLWGVFVTMASGGEVRFTMHDLEMVKPIPVAPPEIRVTPQEAARQMRAIEAEQRTLIGQTQGAYQQAIDAEMRAYRAWRDVDQYSIPGAGMSADMSKQDWADNLARLSREWTTAQAATKALRTIADHTKSEMLDRIRNEVIFHPEPAQIKPVWKSKFTGDVKADIDKQLDGFTRMVGRGRLDGLKINIEKTARGRSFYQFDTVNFGKYMRQGQTVVHELGHWLEDRDANAAKLVKDSYDARTAGQSLVPMGGGYASNERTIPDQFLDRYMGKQYPMPRSHELLSMGMEHMYGDPLRLLREDQKTFEMVWEVLHTGSHVVASSGAEVEKSKIAVLSPSMPAGQVVRAPSAPLMDQSPARVHPPEALVATHTVRSRVAEIEPAVTALLVDQAAREKGAKMVGLDFKIKSVDSLARKITDKTVAKDKGTTHIEVANEIGDVLRYTMEVPAKNYTETVNATIASLKDSGYAIEISNYWPAGGAYRGINTSVSKDDATFELQFHTPQSFTTKEETLHADYEIMRDPKQTLEAQKEAYDRMVLVSNKMTQPAGVLSIGEPILRLWNGGA
jgi:hypothetical protein